MGVEDKELGSTSGASLAVGDWFVAGYWRRWTPIDADGGIDDIPAEMKCLGITLTNGDDNIKLTKPTVHGDGAWEWCYNAAKITAVSSPGTIIFKIRIQATASNINSLEVFAPVAFVIPASAGINDREVELRAQRLHLARHRPSRSRFNAARTEAHRLWWPGCRQRGRCDHAGLGDQEDRGLRRCGCEPRVRPDLQLDHVGEQNEQYPMEAQARRLLREATRYNPIIAFQLLDGTGAPVVLTGATVKFMIQAPGGQPQDQRCCHDHRCSTGKVSYTWSGTNTDTIGDYLAEWQVTFGGGSRDIPQR